MSSDNLERRDEMLFARADVTTDNSPGALQLEKISSSLESKFPELTFTLGRALDNGKQVLVVSQRVLTPLPPFGYTSHIQVTILEDCTYRIHVLLRTLEDGTVSDETEVCALLKKVCNPSYKFCPGIEWAHYHEHYFEVIRFHPKSVHRTEAPFYRVDSVDCKLWFEVPANAPLTAKSSAEVTCSACKRLISNLDWQLKRTTDESPSVKVKRQAASSRARLTYMSPASQVKRKQNAMMEWGLDKRKLTRYENTEITLSEEQDTQMCDVMDQVAVDDLQRIFEEGESHGVGNKLKEIWTMDKRQQLESFQKDQARNGKSFHSKTIV